MATSTDSLLSLHSRTLTYLHTHTLIYSSLIHSRIVSSITLTYLPPLCPLPMYSHSPLTHPLMARAHSPSHTHLPPPTHITNNNLDTALTHPYSPSHVLQPTTSSHSSPHSPSLTHLPTQPLTHLPHSTSIHITNVVIAIYNDGSTSEIEASWINRH